MLTADNLTTLSSVRHGFFTKSYGNPGLSREDERPEALKVRACMAHDLHVDKDFLLTCYQIHSADVHVVASGTSSFLPEHDVPRSAANSNQCIWSADDRPKADALVTDRRGLAIGILTADCVPVLFADQGRGVIAAAHAGWRGAVSGILDNTLIEMERLGARRGSTYAALGPCIWQKSYEVGAEFPAPFVAEDPRHERFFRPAPRAGHYLFDLPGYVMARLQTLGVGSVSPSPADTCAEPERFFSHRYSTLRGEKRSGNLMSAIALF